MLNVLEKILQHENDVDEFGFRWENTMFFGVSRFNMWDMGQVGHVDFH